MRQVSGFDCATRPIAAILSRMRLALDSLVARSLVAATAVAFAGCGDDGSGSDGDTTTAAGTSDGSGSGSTAMPPDTGVVDDSTGGSTAAVIPTEGTWQILVSVVEVGGIELPMQAEITNTTTADGAPAVTIALRATDASGAMVSDVLGTAEAVALDADSNFDADFGDTMLPGPFSPTGTPLTLATLHLIGQFTSMDNACGTLSATVVEVNIELSASTWGATSVASGMSPGKSCDDEPGMPLTRIDAADCPVLVDDFNNEFPSAGLSREFYMYTPTDAATGGPWPLVFAYHGLGDSADFIQVGGTNDLITPIDDRGYILVSPESQMVEGIEWQQGAFGDNEDLVFFDDLITCVDAQYGVDPAQIYVTGMSAGGLYTSFLGVAKSDVIAAVAPFSGGFIPPYEQPDTLVPYLVSWGGKSDQAVNQDFNLLSMDMIADLDAAGHFYATCNHNQGHSWPAEVTEPVLYWLFAHPYGTNPIPYATMLPDTWPAYCTLP